ncbi:CPBP family intramembrane glutamic endopeptidase [Alkalihalobacillus sp. AL-G]|uniref:CPBP family intramembrane glutamic endopeptidase n=1 Tax=Alkalihalobacillus sp. AL-G TaxID=2926399 RepID=UPI00272C2D9C|nr:CPBP family intramembrane glutamic endopeptidase [Alkalihalobacillus sp. AL-G]WLD91860.1 CPBP family intramembrane metalloprotease [Alkalihalobacillus sp. AL-G]
MFNPKKQQQILSSITQKELFMNLYLTQVIFLTVAILLSIVFDQDLHQWKKMMTFDPIIVLLWSFPVAFAVILFDLILWKIMPQAWVDDGGINERIFSEISLFHLALLALVISVSEELLFRGVLQNNIGYIPASLLFALMHIRYLMKPLLLIVATVISLILGGLFLWTENLLVPIVIHFLIDFVLGLMIRFNWFSPRKKGTLEQMEKMDIKENEGGARECHTMTKLQN